jgi:hypothetical protein
MDTPPVNKIRWNKSHRIIPSRYPPIDLFERIADPQDWEKLCEIESLTNPRIREEIGQISLVPPEKRISGPGATYVMASFTHLRAGGSRFSNGSFGIYYAAKTLPTALSETISFMERFYTATEEDRTANDFRTLIGTVSSSFHDIRGNHQQWQIYKTDDWKPSQALGSHLKNNNSNGIVYDSIRHIGGECIGAFWPNVVGAPVQGTHYKFNWNGKKIDKYYNFEEHKWVQIAS